jgi:hypothetical protein
LIQLFLKYNRLSYIWAALALVAIRAAAYKMGIPIIEPELTWLLVGERMTNGFSLYKEIYTDLEPLSAGTYYLLHLLVGKSSFTYFLLSSFLVLMQATLFARSIRQNKIMKEASALPMLMYILLSSLFFDFYTLSPVLLGMSFILWAFHLICVQSRIERGEDLFFYIGLLIGIASMFYLPFLFFLLFAIFALGLYSSTNLRKHLIMLLAFFFPHALLLIYYFWVDNLSYYLTYVWLQAFYAAPDFLVNIPILVKVIILPTLLLLLSVFAIASRGKYIHYQYKIIKIMGLWLLAAVIATGTEKQIAPHLFYLFVPAISFFAAQLFYIVAKPKLFTEVLFAVFAGGILLISFYALQKPDSYTTQHLIKIAPPELKQYGITQKRVMVLGNDRGYYINNSLSCNYENWQLSKPFFDNINRYENIAAFYDALLQNKPEFIIDLEGRIPLLAERIPYLKQNYLLAGGKVYKRINSNEQ